MEIYTYQIEYIDGRTPEKVAAVAYDLADGWFVFYGAGNATQVLRVRAVDVARVVLVTE
jgi:hypothetical protein